MSSRIPQEALDDIRQRVDIVDIIGRYVELKRSGSNFKGLCPFHEEKSPSFNVNPARQFFHCFGCQASGDVFAFLMKLEGRGFGEVVEDLANRAGIELPKDERSAREIADEKRRRSERQRAIDLNDKVATLYRQLLLDEGGASAREYLASRGIGEDIGEAFRLGFAPASGDVVCRALRDFGEEPAFAENLGLIARRRRGPGLHDRFWSRLIFPLIGVGGEVLGFGGRLLGGGDGPKYLNTPETALYRKGAVLYGLWQAAKAIRNRDEAILVEGNFDVLQMHQRGFDNAVAPMGTALTAGQAALLKRFGTRAIALFDGDAAGQAAATKSVPTLLQAGLEARIASLPEGEDPDSLLLKGEGAMASTLGAALPAIEHIIKGQVAQLGDSTLGRARIVEAVAPLLRMLTSPVARELYVDKLAYDLGLERGAVVRALRSEGAQDAAREGPRARSSRRPPAGQTTAATPGEPKRPPVAPLPVRDVDLLKMLLAQPTLFPRAQRDAFYRLLTNDHLRATYAAAAQMQAAVGSIDLPGLLEAAPLEVRDAVAEAALCRDYAGATGGDPNRMLDDWLVVTLSERLKRVRNTTDERIKNTQRHGLDTRPWVERMVALQGLTSRFDRARRERQLEEAAELIAELIQVERDIHDTH